MSSFACSTEERWELTAIILKIAPMTINSTSTTMTNSTTENPRVRSCMILISHHHSHVYRAGKKQIAETTTLQLSADGDHVGSRLRSYQSDVPSHVINSLFNPARGARRLDDVGHVVI